MIPLKRFLFLMGCIVMVSACSHKNFDENLQTLEGQSIARAINYFGIPDDKFTLQEKEIYVWGHDQINIVQNQGPITTYGGYGSRGGPFGGVGIVFGTPRATNVNSQYCKIKMIVNENQIIEKIERDSTTSACSKYNKAIDAIEADTLKEAL